MSQQSGELRKTALKEFKAGNYNEAFVTFYGLTSNYPQQLEYNYYSARCIFELKKADMYDYALNCFEIAAVYGEYFDAWFYIGRINHIQNNYNEALKAYNRFLEIANKRMIKSLEVNKYIGLAENDLKKSSEREDIMVTDSLSNRKNYTGLITVQKTYNDAGNFPEFYEFMKPAMKLQMVADSFLRASKIKRDQMKVTEDGESKKKLTSEINQMEQSSKIYQKKADSLFNIISQDIQKMTMTTNLNNKKSYSVNDYLTPEILVSDTLYYTIQLGIFSKKTGDDLFKSISPVFYKVLKNESFKYYKGVYLKYIDAAESLKNIKQSGFSDVFIVAFYNNNQIAVEKAREIEYSFIDF